jgi:hypothetical protein
MNSAPPSRSLGAEPWALELVRPESVHPLVELGLARWDDGEWELTTVGNKLLRRLLQGAEVASLKSEAMQLHFIHGLRIFASIGPAIDVWSGGVLSSLVVRGDLIAVVRMIICDVRRCFRHRDNLSALSPCTSAPPSATYTFLIDWPARNRWVGPHALAGIFLGFRTTASYNHTCPLQFLAVQRPLYGAPRKCNGFFVAYCAGPGCRHNLHAPITQLVPPSDTSSAYSVIVPAEETPRQIQDVWQFSYAAYSAPKNRFVRMAK